MIRILSLTIVSTFLAIQVNAQFKVTFSNFNNIGGTSTLYDGANYIINQRIILKNINLPKFVSDLKFVYNETLSKDVNDIPAEILYFLKQMSKDGFTIANPGQQWNCCCDQDPELPDREMILCGQGRNFFFLSYYTGGMATTQHLVLVQYHGMVQDLWSGILPGKLHTKEQILNYLLEKGKSVIPTLSL